ncbi:MAG: COX15/CtaA family protein, partial [Vicinamibacteria bacterium]|nr:COX15/CtaA family protein [Vicinamibacteria bacterium]
IALLLVALLAHHVFRHREKGHLARFWASAAMALILSEAALGAGLVLYQRVAEDASLARGFWISGHLINTFLLLAALTLTWRFVDDPDRASRAAAGGVRRASFPRAAEGFTVIPAVIALMAIGVSGAIAALGDTLFKAQTLREAITQDFSSASHIFLRLRVFHPLLALAGGGFVLVLAYRTITSNPDRPESRRRGLSLAGLVVGQWFLGLTNLVLLAPTVLQIAHLLVADLIWITLVLVAADEGPGS